MAKIMLVEDDNNLREIYEARLLAEGYEIVSAKDGEEALALAVKERPDLIISDVMMPKISGFDMLDILRSTPETKETKVIMMTALSQAEDKTRADKLGADRYLVKSQVTLEDVAKVAREVLQGKTESESSAPEPTEPTEPPAEPPTPTAPSEPTEPPAPAAPSSPAPEPPAADDSIDSSAAQAAVAAPDDGQAQTPPPAETT
jgi:CheY-like chemotaxis protein